MEKQRIEEKAYAKINLNLRVIGKENGYHNLETIMTPIDLYDTLFFEKSDVLEIEGINIIDSSIHQAARLFINKYHTGNCKITVIKRIPTEAGLGGGSADASATLRGLNRLFNLKLPLKELEVLANELGSDNTYCLYNQLALCRGRGEKVELIEKAFTYNVLLIKPSFGLATKKVFEQVIINDEVIDSWSLINNISDLEYINANLKNDLFAAALKIKPELKLLVDRINNLGFMPHMTGSGSTIFVISDDVEKLKTLSLSFSDCFIKLCLIKNCF